MRIATDFRPERLSVRMSRLLLCLVLIATLPVAAAGQGASAQEGATDERPTAARPAGDQAESEQTGEAQPLAASDLSTPEARYRWFAETLSGARLDGHFTFGGGDNPPRLHSEKYDILKAEKLPAGEMWLFTTRIRYGEHDVTVPIPLPVLWAGTTPIITLDNLTIPGMGTFDARVVITRDQYAGTWRHGEAGGHLFGRIVKPEANEDAEDEAAGR